MLTHYQKARAIIKKYGKGYYRATFLFPKSAREATWIYYQFLRTADECVDDPLVQDHFDALQRFITAWKSKDTHYIHGALFNSYERVLERYSIPHIYTDIFLSSMEQDLSKTRYATYHELEKYMEGSAVVVGYTMTYIIGYTEGALEYAKALGEAFQMVNFLRDIKEDYDSRGRIYIPVEDMQRFGVTEEQIQQGVTNDAWRALMKFEIERTKALYDKGVSGIAFLDKKGRRAVYAAALIYKDILDLIEKNNYDIFSRRLVVSPLRKTVLLLKALWKRSL